ncbi:GntR family transcriptional regulator [Oceanobacillus timonensis]|uniref:GntR family transcriptional regulator n=1 Tax=Oceanobacillus timonensis TaxID=1926285 RepID=UPI0015C477D4|nr:GntR family transcriptional regulator [Oceanobacillus timonensis]
MASSKKEQVYIEIKKRILNNYYEQGEYLEEKEICETFKVSRTPVREAMNKLASENLVYSVPKQGTFVTTLSTQDIKQIFQVRYIIETSALDLSFDKLEKEELINFKNKFIEEIRNENYQVLHELDYEFHNYINSKCGNKYLHSFLSRIQDNFQRVRTQEFYTKNRTLGGAEEHLEIIDNILTANKQRSIELLESHISSTEKYYFKSLI